MEEERAGKTPTSRIQSPPVCISAHKHICIRVYRNVKVYVDLFGGIDSDAFFPPSTLLKYLCMITHANTHTRTHTHAPTHKHNLSLIHSLSHTHTNTRTNTHAPHMRHTQTHRHTSLSLCLSHLHCFFAGSKSLCTIRKLLLHLL